MFGVERVRPFLEIVINLLSPDTEKHCVGERETASIIVCLPMFVVKVNLWSCTRARFCFERFLVKWLPWFHEISKNKTSFTKKK